MNALEINGRTVGCYDDRMLVLFEPNSVLLALVLPAWLENFVHDAAPQRDRAADAHRLARVALTSRNTGSGRFLSLRQEVAAKRRKCEEARISREALEAYLQQHRPSFDPETIMDAVEALADDPTWELEVRYGVVRLKLRDLRVRDPRDGTWRRLPSTLTVHLGDWLAGVGPFKDHPQDAPVSGRHPRVCGRGFLHAEIDEAVHDCLRASDLAGGLALIHDVLTSFEADDPDVAALDHWRHAREAA